MKLAWKFFCIAYIVVLIVASAGTSLLVKLTTDTVLNELKENAFTANTYAVRSFLTLSAKNIGEITDERLSTLSEQICEILESEKIEDLEIAVTDDEQLNIFEQSSYIKKTSDASAGMIVCYCVAVNDTKYTVTTTTDLSSYYIHRQMLWRYYSLIIFVISVLSGILLFVITRAISKPIDKLSSAVADIADGNYGELVEVTESSSEIKNLSENFNKMSVSIKSTTDALREEAEKQSAFIANFTHELKTPMTSIIGYADLLRRYELDAKELRQSADIIYNEGKRLEQLSMNLLDLLVLNKADFELKKISLKALSEKFYHSLRFTAEKYGVNIRIALPDVNVTANEALLISLVYNLTDNACKASEKGQTVTVTATEDKGLVTVEIIDNGTGIDESDIKRITEPFYMADKSRSRKNGGAGLGLSLCKRIAELHGTMLCFESKKGEGTSVSFTLKSEVE